MALSLPTFASGPAPMNPCQGQTDPAPDAWENLTCDLSSSPVCFYDPSQNRVECDFQNTDCETVDVKAVTYFSGLRTYTSVFGDCPDVGSFCCAQEYDWGISGYVDQLHVFGTKSNDQMSFQHNETGGGWELTDTASAVKMDATLHGQRGVDTLTVATTDSPTYSEALHGGEGNDTLRGLGGDDNLYGDAGVDYLYGGPGRDNLWGGDGQDYLYGQDGDDTLRGGNDSDRMFGDAGVDTMYGNGGRDYMWGGTEGDTMFGNNGSDWMLGEEGDDTLYGNANTTGILEKLYGGNGNDDLRGGAGEDELHGGPDNDRLWGAGKDDVLYGDEGIDKLYGGGDNDALNGGDGNDFLCERDFGDDAAFQYFFGGTGTDTLVYWRTAASPVIQFGQNDVRNIYSEGSPLSMFDDVWEMSQPVDVSAGANTAVPECNEMF